MSIFSPWVFVVEFLDLYGLIALLQVNHELRIVARETSKPWHRAFYMLWKTLKLKLPESHPARRRFDAHITMCITWPGIGSMRTHPCASRVALTDIVVRDISATRPLCLLCGCYYLPSKDSLSAFFQGRFTMLHACIYIPNHLPIIIMRGWYLIIKTQIAEYYPERVSLRHFNSFEALAQFVIAKVHLWRVDTWPELDKAVEA